MRFPSLGLSDRAATLGRSSSSGERLTKVGAIANHLVISIMYVFSVSSCPARHFRSVRPGYIGNGLYLRHG